MANGQTVSDLVVKSIRVQKLTGSGWVRPPEPHFVPDARYRVNVVFGNSVRVTWPDEQYRKDHVNLRLVSLGFYIGGSYRDRDYLVFYTNGQYTSALTRAAYRTSFDIHSYETTHADVEFTGYFKLRQGVHAYAITSWRWDIGVYASVRNKYWKKVMTGV